MKTRNSFSRLLHVAVLMTCLFCVAAKAEEEELFDLNNIIVKGELYVWNRISDALDLFRCGKNADSYRKVVCRTLFADVGGGKVDNDFSARHTESDSSQSRVDSHLALLDGVVGKSHHKKGESWRHFGFYRNCECVDTVNRARVCFNKHLILKFC